MSSYGKISVIVPCYWANLKLLDMTQDCLDSIKQESVHEIIVVDDGSPIDWVHPDYKFIAYEKNKGYAGAVNTAFKAISGDLIVVANNDLTFPQKWLRGLLRALDEGFDVATCWTSDQKVKLEDKIEENAKFGSIFAMDRGVYEEIGGFDEQFRGYFADTDYRRRLLDAGYTIGKNLNFVIPHKGKSTYRITDPKDKEYLRSKLLYEAKWGYLE